MKKDMNKKERSEKQKANEKRLGEMAKKRNKKKVKFIDTYNESKELDI